MKAALLSLGIAAGLLTATAAQAHDYVVLARVVSVEPKVTVRQESIPSTECFTNEVPIYDRWNDVIGYRRNQECTTTTRTRTWRENHGYLINYEWNGYHGQFPSSIRYGVGTLVNVRMTLTGGL